MTRIDALPLQFQPLLYKVAALPPQVGVLWRYGLFVMLINDERAHIREIHQEGDRLHLVVQNRAGERFEVIRPDITEELEQELLEIVREVYDRGFATGQIIASVN